MGGGEATRMVKAIIRPSGDHASAPGPRSTRVTWLVAPSSSIQRTKIWPPAGSPLAT